MQYEKLPPPRIVNYDGILVVRDDLLPGGTKQRILEEVLPQLGRGIYVYAGPVTGFAGIALAYACKRLGKNYRAVIFQARRKEPHPRTLLLRELGASVEEVGMGRLSNVRAKARRYCVYTGARLLPWGLDAPIFEDALIRLAKALPIEPEEAWSVAGSGMLSRALQAAWPEARFYAVNISQHKVAAGRATVFQAPEPFESDAKDPPPFPSCSNYDAKAWQFVWRMASPGALFWNVAA